MISVEGHPPGVDLWACGVLGYWWPDWFRILHLCIGSNASKLYLGDPLEVTWVHDLLINPPVLDLGGSYLRLDGMKRCSLEGGLLWMGWFGMK